MNHNLYCFLVAADVSNDKSEWVGQELTKSDRPELASASIVVAGGIIIISFHLKIKWIIFVLF